MLNLHQESHFTGKDNRCKECNKTWSLRSYYVQHMKRVHGKDIVDMEKPKEHLAVVEGFNEEAEMLNNEALLDALLNAVQDQGGTGG